MPDEINELLDVARYKEIASQAFYIAAQSKTQDPAAKALLAELAEEELKHSLWLGTLIEGRPARHNGHRGKVPNLMISDYLTGAETVDNAGLQETLIFAMKREQQSLDFYSRMMGVMRNRLAKNLCRRLVAQELRHKLRLEILYDDLFYAED